MLDSYWFIIAVVPLVKMLLTAAASDAPKATVVVGKQDFSSGLLAVYLLADDNSSFLGYDLLQSCTANNLQYDQKLAIFHKYCDRDGARIKCFSVARASKPGCFDIDSLGGFASKGIVCFIDIKTLGKHALEFYDDFITTLEGLQSNLGGRLYDKYKNPITDSVVSEWRQYAKIICMRYGTADFFTKG